MLLRAVKGIIAAVVWVVVGTATVCAWEAGSAIVIASDPVRGTETFQPWVTVVGVPVK